MRKVLRALNDATIRFPKDIEAFASDDNALKRAMTIVPFIYLFLLFQAFSIFGRRIDFMQGAELFAPLWPIAWLADSSASYAGDIVSGIFLITALIAVVFYSRRWARLGAFVGFFLFHAWLSSFGTVDHTWLPWVYVLFFLIFLPDIWNQTSWSVYERKSFLLGFFTTQVYLGLLYTLTGLGKVVRGFSHLISGESNFLSPDAFALVIADWFEKSGYTSLLGPAVLEHPYLGWPFFLFVHYLQLFALWAIFRPNLQRVWGTILICFHVATFLTMGILYVNTIFLLGALLVFSPFEQRVPLRARLKNLPVVGMFYNRLTRSV